jgi:putative oxidoreductase
MKLGSAVARIVMGALFFGHGAQKLFGWFGGHGPEGTGQFFEQLGLRPGKRNAMAAGGAEALGGVMLAGGFLMPVAAAMITGTMVTAIRTVHGSKGPWVTEGGYEYNLVLMASMFALTDRGPGDWSLDNALGLDLKGPFWAIGQLAAGVAGSELTLRTAQSAPEPPATPDLPGDPSPVADHAAATA